MRLATILLLVIIRIKLHKKTLIDHQSPGRARGCLALRANPRSATAERGDMTKAAAYAAASGLAKGCARRLARGLGEVAGRPRLDGSRARSPVAILTATTLLLAACGTDENPAAVDNAAVGTCPSGKDLNGAGASSIKLAIADWTAMYQGQCPGIGINYDAQGSGNGRMQFVQKQVPFAGSDVPLPSAQRGAAQRRCAPGQAINLPMSVEPIAIVYHLQGVDKLTVTPSLVAKIFNGKIRQWNDPALAAVNPGVPLPNKTTTPVHRSADSGTSENLTRFLAAQAKADWPYPPAQAWPNNVGPGAAVSTNMVLLVKQTDGAIGYVDNPDATSNKLPTAAIDTGHGPVRIGSESIGKVIAASKVNKNGLDVPVDLAYGLKAPGAYPALMVTYLITCSQGLPADQAGLVKSFLTLTAGDQGQELIAKAGYIPLPTSLRGQVQAAVAQLSGG
jgi:phosphate ABC transporter phosphate-binding protein